MVQDSIQTPVMVEGADPAAGAEVSDTVPAGELWEVLGVIFTIVADANAANRTINASFQDANSNEIYKAVNADAITATQTIKFEVLPFAGALPANVAASTQFGALPQSFWLGPGCKIKTTTTNKQVGDNYGKTKYWVRKWTPST